MFEEKFFLRRKANDEALLRYGFTKEENGFLYETAVMDGQFRLRVSVTPQGVSTKMTDTAADEEYTLYKSDSSVGSFVGEVRSACESVLREIAEACFEADVFRTEQSLAAIRFIREKFGDELEFLWEKFPENAVWRRKDNRKWYGILAVVPRNKLGLDSAEKAEIMDLRFRPEDKEKTLDGQKYFPGWHMNKNRWYTLILDGSVPTEEIFCRIEESYRLAAKG